MYIGPKVLEGKGQTLRASFLASIKSGKIDNSIKWSRNLKGWISKSTSGREIEQGCIRPALYRPYAARSLYDSNTFVDERGALDRYLPVSNDEQLIALSGAPAGKPFHALATRLVPSLDLLEKTKIFPRYRYTKSGERVDNITDWAVAQFEAHYAQELARERFGYRQSDAGPFTVHSTPPPSDDGKPPPFAALRAKIAAAKADKVARPWVAERWGGAYPAITKDAIFAYCYAVLHDPVYRDTYALNLKREFPRIPFYPDFARWVASGETLLALHIGYEDVAPFALTRTDVPAPKRAEGTNPKPKLKSIPDTGTVVVDEDTQVSGIPRAAWDYRLGNRSAIDWVLDQHKEKTPRDPTIRAKFNTYRFADYKESMVALLARVVTVSLETVAITDAMRALCAGVPPVTPDP